MMIEKLPWEDQISKPVWMSRELYSDLCLRWQDEMGFLHCKTCGTADNLSWDHIVPRDLGGKDIFENLQPMCMPHNRLKATRPDEFWRKPLYFDREINLDKLRISQRNAYYLMCGRYASFFMRPRRELSGYIYLLAWIVSAGKTISIPALAFAYNRMILEQKGYAPRADKILILTKERGLRDQIYNELNGVDPNLNGSDSELVKYGIVSEAPKVLKITNGSQWENQEYWLSYDIVIACEQQLWEAKTNTRTNWKVEAILSHFPLIFTDENHFASDQINRIVDLASNSLCFGLTSTPIDSDSDLLKKIILFSLYDYHDANRLDHSVKALPTAKEYLDYFFEELTIEGSDGMAMLVQSGVEKLIKKEIESTDYGLNWIPIVNVAHRVIQYMKESDTISFTEDNLSPHRNYTNRISVPDLDYPVHSIIKVDDIKTARNLKKVIDGILNQDRRTYLVSDGWDCEIVNSEDGYLDADHPWFTYKNTKQLSSACSRILIVVNMAREGMNNPYCAVIGLACSVNSYIEVIQFAIGRAIRSVHFVDENGILHVPDQRKDSPLIITHKAFDNREPVWNGIDWVMSMEGYLSELPTIERIESGEQPENSNLQMGVDGLKEIELHQLIDAEGYYLNKGIEIEPRKLIELVLGKDASASKVERALKWLDKIRDDPEEVVKFLRLNGEPLKQRGIIKQERLSIDNITDEQLLAYVRTHKSPKYFQHFATTMRNENKEIRDVLRQAVACEYVEYRNPLTERDLLPDSDEHISDILKAHLSILGERGKAYAEDKNYGRTVFSQGYIAAKQILGVRSNDVLADQSDYDIPQYRQVLSHWVVGRDIRGYVMRKLIDFGYFKNMAVALKINSKGRNYAQETTEFIFA